MSKLARRPRSCYRNHPVLSNTQCNSDQNGNMYPRGGGVYNTEISLSVSSNLQGRFRAHSRTPLPPSPRTRGTLPPAPPRLRELAGAELRLWPPLPNGLPHVVPTRSNGRRRPCGGGGWCAHQLRITSSVVSSTYSRLSRRGLVPVQSGGTRGISVASLACTVIRCKISGIWMPACPDRQPTTRRRRSHLTHRVVARHSPGRCAS